MRRCWEPGDGLDTIAPSYGTCAQAPQRGPDRARTVTHPPRQRSGVPRAGCRLDRSNPSRPGDARCVPSASAPLEATPRASSAASTNAIRRSPPSGQSTPTCPTEVVPPTSIALGLRALNASGLMGVLPSTHSRWQRASSPSLRVSSSMNATTGRPSLVRGEVFADRPRKQPVPSARATLYAPAGNPRHVAAASRPKLTTWPGWPAIPRP